jgi:hypothetical protein
MMNVVMLSVDMLNVIMLSVVMLNVVTPRSCLCKLLYNCCNFYYCIIFINIFLLLSKLSGTMGIDKLDRWPVAVAAEWHNTRLTVQDRGFESTTGIWESVKYTRVS